MGDDATIKWTGQSGQEYLYYIYRIADRLKHEGGNYIFAEETSPGRWAPRYIGQTEDLNDRLDDHEKEACAKRHGATHIHAHLNTNKQARLAEEKDLILKWQPPCNDQYVT